MNEFITPPKHINFKAKKLFGAVGEIIDGSIAYVDLNGGGPEQQHTHEHNHLFIVVKGEAKVLLGEEEIIIILFPEIFRILFGTAVMMKL